MHVDCWIQQVTTRVGAVTCWIQQSVSPKQVVGFSCLFNSEVDQLISKSLVVNKNPLVEKRHGTARGGAGRMMGDTLIFFPARHGVGRGE